MKAKIKKFEGKAKVVKDLNSTSEKLKEIAKQGKTNGEGAEQTEAYIVDCGPFSTCLYRVGTAKRRDA